MNLIPTLSIPFDIPLLLLVAVLYIASLYLKGQQMSDGAPPYGAEILAMALFGPFLELLQRPDVRNISLSGIVSSCGSSLLAWLLALPDMAMLFSALAYAFRYPLSPWVGILLLPILLSFFIVIIIFFWDHGSSRDSASTRIIRSLSFITASPSSTLWLVARLLYCALVLIHLGYAGIADRFAFVAP